MLPSASLSCRLRFCFPSVYARTRKASPDVQSCCSCLQSLSSYSFVKLVRNAQMMISTLLFASLAIFLLATCLSSIIFVRWSSFYYSIYYCNSIHMFGIHMHILDWCFCYITYFPIPHNTTNIVCIYRKSARSKIT